MAEAPAVTQATQVVDLELIPAEASSPEVLAREPNTYEKATEGPHPQISATTYVTWTTPNGDTILAPLSNSETYERKGYKKGAEQEIPDLSAYWAEQASHAPATAAPAKPAATTTKTVEKS